MAVRSTRLGIWKQSSGSADSTILTVPAGRTAIVKTVTSYNATGGSSLHEWYVDTGGGVVRNFAMNRTLGSGLTWIERELFVVVLAGESLKFFADGGHHAAAFGSLLLGDPS